MWHSAAPQGKVQLGRGQLGTMSCAGSRMGAKKAFEFPILRRFVLPDLLRGERLMSENDLRGRCAGWATATTNDAARISGDGATIMVQQLNVHPDASNPGLRTASRAGWRCI